jgi:putative phosphoesterase
MNLGIVSDTHGHIGNTIQAVSVLEEHDVGLVIHCGDIGSINVIALFTGKPTHFVFGNVDHSAEQIRLAIEEAGQTCHGRFGSLDIDGTKIAFLHSDDSRLFQETISSGEWDLVCYGHTHEAESHREGNALVLNPGALYRANPHSLAIVELPSLQVEHVTLS